MDALRTIMGVVMYKHRNGGCTNTEGPLHVILQFKRVNMNTFIKGSLDEKLPF